MDAPRDGAWSDPRRAFGPSGSHLGRGGGYYDRTIKALRSRVQKPQIIGVAAHQQFIESLETDPHDEPLDGKVTDKGLLWSTYSTHFWVPLFDVW